MDSELGQMRLRALRDPTSTYYRAYCGLLREATERREAALAARRKVVLPFSVPNEVRLDCERKFPTWRVEVQDHGLRDRVEVHASAIIFLLSLRNSMVVSMDGEEVVELDGDLPAAVAKGQTYVHVCRTSASDRLVASYQWEDMQVRRLSYSSKPLVAAQARGALQGLQQAEGSAVVCHSAVTCRRRAEVLRINLMKTPVSLAQAVTTAEAHGATEVHVCALFQAEMLMATEGELVSFPGTFLVDKRDDTLSYIPKSDPGAGFTVPYSSLVSFFLNHSHVSQGYDWVVEKFLGEHGMFHCVVQRVESTRRYEFPCELGTNYYVNSLSRWVRVHYPRRGVTSAGVPSASWEEVYDDIPEAMYADVLKQMLSVDAKRLTLEEVYTCLRNANNNVLFNGDTVKVPDRVWATVTSRLAVPLLALVVMRREALSAQLSLGLKDAQKRFGFTGDGALSLVIATAAAVVDRAWTLSVRALLSSDLPYVASLEGMKAGATSLEIRVEELADSMAVRGVVGTRGSEQVVGRYEPWLPAPRRRRLELLQRARALVEAVGSVFSGSGASEDADVFVDAPEAPSEQEAATYVTVEERFEELPSVELTARQQELLEKLVAEQDAAVVSRTPRLVRRFEGVNRVDVVPCEAVHGDPLVAAQDDYDRIFPSAVADDEEVKPRLAAEADFSRSVSFHGALNESKRELPPARVIRRSRARAAGAAEVPRSQFATLTALFKRNAEVPNTRGYVDLDAAPARVVDRVFAVCMREDWPQVLAKELEDGLWQPNIGDLEEYVPKLEQHKASALLEEVFSLPDVDMRTWLLMTKAKAKPPLDAGAAAKVQQPQTIMYSESKSMNAMYSAMCTRFYHALDAMFLPNVKFNHRHAPWEFEEWFNSLNPVRASCRTLHAYEADIWNYDRSQEMMGFAVEFELYRRTFLNRETLAVWSLTHGEKRAVSVMHGLLMYIVQEGLSGIHKTLLRNGIICLAALVYSADLQREDVVSLSVTGDDCVLELNRPVGVGPTVDGMALCFNLSVKLFGVEAMYFCSRYIVLVDGWWYWVKDPVKQFESTAKALVCTEGAATLSERFVALCDDLRHYDDGAVCEALAVAVQVRYGLRFVPHGLVRGLSAMAADRDEFSRTFGPEEVIG